MFTCAFNKFHLIFCRRLINEQFTRKRFVYSSAAPTFPSSSIEDEVNHATDDWWNPDGSAWLVHQMNNFRMTFIGNELNRRGLTNRTNQPMQGLKMLDVGCGGGILSESLAQLGADVTGLDPSVDMIKVAENHAKFDPVISSKLKYITLRVEDHAVNFRQQYDAIVVFFVLEQVKNRTEFLSSCFKLLKPNGSLFIQHCNRTWLLYLTYMWETYLASRIQTGMFDYRALFNTEDLLEMLSSVASGDLKVVRNYGIRKKINAEICWTESDKYWNFMHVVKVK